MTQRKSDLSSMDLERGVVTRMSSTLHTSHPNAHTQDIGRDRNDTAGARYPWRDWIFHCCSVACTPVIALALGADWCHSRVTGKPRGLGKEKPLVPGVGHLKSYAIATQLDTSDPSKNDEEQCRGFLRRYYGHCNIWDTTGDALQKEYDKLRDQLFTDVSDRRLNKRSGTRIMDWFSTFVAAFLIINSLTNQIVLSENGDTRILDVFTYIGGALGAVQLIGQLFNALTGQSDADAIKALERVARWAKVHVEARQAEEAEKTTPKHPRALPKLSHALQSQDYVVRHLRHMTHGNGLSASIAALLSTTDTPLTPQQVEAQLQAYRTNQAVQPKTTFQGLESLQDVIDLSQAYALPIFVVHEALLPNGQYTYLINEEPPEREEIENQSAYQAQHQNKAIILYSATPNQYQPVLAPIGLSGAPTRFEILKRELLALKPEPDMDDGFDFFEEKEGELDLARLSNAASSMRHSAAAVLGMSR